MLKYDRKEQRTEILKRNQRRKRGSKFRSKDKTMQNGMRVKDTWKRTPNGRK